MKIIVILKIFLGAIITFGALNNIPGVFRLPNLAQASGYITVTLIFFAIGVYLIYSEIQQNKKLPKR